MEPTLDELRNISRCIADAERERDQLLRRLRESHSIPVLAEASGLSTGTVHARTKRIEVVTIGYEGRSVDDLVTELCRERVSVLLDVRENAISRKKGFSKSALSDACRDAGLQYEHERALGNPRDNRDGFRSGSVASHRRYAERLISSGAEAVARLLSLAGSRRVALLCYERAACDCHRSVLASHLGALDPRVSVRHV